MRQGYAAAASRCYAGQRQPAYAAVAEWLRSDAVQAGWTKLRVPQLAELSRLIPEVDARFPNLELTKSGERVGLPENWQRLLFYDCLNAAIAKEPQTNAAVSR